MQPFKARVIGLALTTVLFAFSMSSRAAIESNFDDQVYPGAAGNGWVGGWEHTTGNTPAVLTASPIDGSTPYLNFGTVAGAARNLIRQYESGAGVDLTQPYYIRWKFRLNEEAFAGNFTVFNDRVHFFARNAARPTGSTDVNISWSIMATGNEQTAGSGVSAGQTFWIFDNVDGTGAFNLGNHADSHVPLIPQNVYSFSVLIDPEIQSYSVTITNETSGAWFKSSAPHRFRASGVTATSHTFLHFGIQANPTADVRLFDLDSVVIEPWAGPLIVNVLPAAYVIQAPQAGLQFEVVAATPVPQGNVSLKLNGTDVSSQLSFAGTDTHWNVSYSGLVANQKYLMEITALNTAGTRSLTRTFYTATAPMSFYNSEGFTSNDLYPVGPLQAVTHGQATWQPGLEPSEIRDDPVDGKVLDRENWLGDRQDYLHLPPLASGTIVVEFKAKVSRTDTRTFDVSLMPQTGGLMSSMLGWGVITDKVAYYDGAAWQPLANLDTAWHTYKLVHYLSGPAAGYFDVSIDNTPVGVRLPWRDAITAGTAFSRFRLRSDPVGTIFEYGRIDDLVIIGTPEDPNAFPPPAIVNVNPFPYAVIRASEGIQFNVSSVLPVTASAVKVVLNGLDVSSGLVVSGPNTNLTVAYNQLSGGQRYTAELSATNSAGATTETVIFTATDAPLTLFNSGGFESEELYPLGPLQASTNAGVRWTPAASPSEFVDIGAPHNKVLKRLISPAGSDFMDFPPVASGIITVEADVLVSTVAVRTLDFCLLWPNSNANGAMASFLSWGTVADNVSYYNGTAWVPVFQPGVEWKRYSTINYLSGPNANTFDLKIDGVLVGQKLSYRNQFPPQTAVGRLRFGALTASEGNYGQFDNILISVEPLPIAIDPITLINPVHTGTTFSLSFTSQVGTSHAVRYKASLTTGDWTTLETITGDGTLKTVTHTNPPAGPLFYRVESVRP